MPPDDENLLRSLRREIGAPNRPPSSASSSHDNSGGGTQSGIRGSAGGVGGVGGTTSRRVGGGGGINNLSSSGFHDAEDGRDGAYVGNEDELAGQEYGLVMFDPVWGQPDYPPGHHTTGREFCGILCCPCIMGKDGCRGAKNRNVWKRIRTRAAVITCGIDIAMFLVSIVVNGGFQPLWGRRNANPLVGPSAMTLIGLGAKHVGLIQEGQIWRFLTPILLHGGVLHMIMNLSSQFRLGTFLEERWGTRNWLLIYWVGGLAGNLLSCAVSPDKIGVGASGAIYAIMGGWLAHIKCTWNEEDEFNKCAQLTQALGFTLVGMVLSIAPIVDWAAHAGGLIAGLMLGWWLFHKPTEESRHMLREPLWRKVVRLQGMISMWALVVAMTFLLYWSLFVAICHIPVHLQPPRPAFTH